MKLDLFDLFVDQTFSGSVQGETRAPPKDDVFAFDLYIPSPLFYCRGDIRDLCSAHAHAFPCFAL
jgi:hypothetical protein